MRRKIDCLVGVLMSLLLLRVGALPRERAVRPSTAAKDGPQRPQRHGQRGEIGAASSVEFGEGLASAANGGCMTALPRRHGGAGVPSGLRGRGPGMAQNRGGELAEHGVEVVP